MKKLGQAVFLAFVAWLTMFADCDRNVTRDPGFSDWCGDKLCSWNVEHGAVKRVPTWDKNDFGVEFETGADAGDPDNFVQISQVTLEDEAQCLLFTSVGDFDPEAQVSVGADFNNDGTIDFEGALGSAAWTQVQTEITAPSLYRGITFYVQKRGLSTATLAQMRVQASQGCTAPAVVLHDLPMGDTCLYDGGAGGCAAGLTCPALVFGVGLCSQCGSCPGAVPCVARSDSLPFQCGPGMHLGSNGAPCLQGADCASGSCVGAKANKWEADAGSCDLEAPIGPDAGDNCKGFGAIAGVCQ